MELSSFGHGLLQQIHLSLLSAFFWLLLSLIEEPNNANNPMEKFPNELQLISLNLFTDEFGLPHLG